MQQRPIVTTTTTVVAAQTSPVLQLRLSLSSSSGSDSTAEQEDSVRSVARKGVRWDAEAIDNEGLGKKSSKKCCIFHKQRKFDDPYEDEDAEDKLRRETKKKNEKDEAEQGRRMINGSGDSRNNHQINESTNEIQSHTVCKDHGVDHLHKHAEQGSTESECKAHTSAITSSSITGCQHCERIKAIDEEAKRRQELVYKETS
jgi:protein phosphatase 1 regulatory subunit 11